MIDIQWTLRYPDARYPNASVSWRFFLGTDFLTLFCLIYLEFRVPDPDGLYLPPNAFLHYILVSLIRTVDFDDRCLSTLVNIPELGVNCCKNTGLAYCFYKTTCDNVWTIVCNLLNVTCIYWPVIWIRSTYLIKIECIILDNKNNIKFLVI